VIFPIVEGGLLGTGQKASKYFFDDTNTRSFYHRENILANRRQAVTGVRLQKGIKEYAAQGIGLWLIPSTKPGTRSSCRPARRGSG
jgi:hypothetical protein